MKRLLCLVLALILLLALAACGQKAPAATEEPAATEAPVSTEEPAATEEPVPAEEPEPTEEPIPTEEPEIAEEPVPAEEPAAAEEGGAQALVFSTTDRDGAAWDESALADYTLIMLNFWEPWCPPCVAEMPDLEKLYQAYAEQGFLILGVYSTEGMESEADAVLADAGTTYPILHYCEAFDAFQTGYVPTTVFVNGAGELVGSTVIGSQPYARWAAVVEDLL